MLLLGWLPNHAMALGVSRLASQTTTLLLYCFSSAKPGSVHSVQLAEAVWPPFKQLRVLILTPSFVFNVDIEHEEIACIFALALSHEAG